MTEKYDLKEMLAEIKIDEALERETKDVKVSQDEIKRLLARKREGRNT